MSERTAWVLYLNHRGETRWRCVRPLELRFGTMPPWHTEPAWLLEVIDLERAAGDGDASRRRSLLLQNCLGWRTTAPPLGEGTTMLTTSPERPG